MKNIIIILFLLTSLFGCAQSSHTLTGTIQDYPYPVLYLHDYYGSENTCIDSVQVDKNGSFQFQLSNQTSTGFYRLADPQKPLLDLIINQENISFTTNYHSPMKELIILKSQENQLYYDYLDVLTKRQEQSKLLGQLVAYYPSSEDIETHLGKEQIQAELQYVREQQKTYEQSVIENYSNSYFAKILKIQQNPEIPQTVSLDPATSRQWLKQHFFDKVDFSDERLLHSTVLVSKVSAFLGLFRDETLDFSEQGHAYMQAIEQVLEKAAANEKVHKLMLNEIAQGFKKTDYDQVNSYLAQRYAEIHGCENPELSAEMMAKAAQLDQLSIGQPAPPIQIPDHLGKRIDLSEIDAEFTLVVFWASWCSHCQELLPEIKAIYQEQNEGTSSTPYLEVVAISLDEDESDWKKIISWGNYNWINLSERKGWESQVVETYNVWATPKMFLLDKNKKIVARPMNSQQVTEFFQPLTSSNP